MLHHRRLLLPTFLFAIGLPFSLIACSSGRATVPTPERVIATVLVTAPPPLASTPQFTLTPSVQEMWVCVEVAIGYIAPSKDSAPLFQMSQRDGWQVRALERSDDWYAVRTGDILAFMPASTLCSTQPALSGVTAISTELAPTIMPTAALPATPRQVLPPPPPKPIATSPALATRAPLATGCPQGCVNPPPGCAIKGNVSTTTGERIYHLPGGRYYDLTVISPSYGERWFCTEAEAVSNGWRKSAQ